MERLFPEHLTIQQQQRQQRESTLQVSLESPEAIIFAFTVKYT